MALAQSVSEEEAGTDTHLGACRYNFRLSILNCDPDDPCKYFK